MDSGFFMATFFDPAHKPIIVGKGDHRLFNKLFLCIHYHISLRLFVCTGQGLQQHSGHETHITKDNCRFTDHFGF